MMTFSLAGKCQTDATAIYKKVRGWGPECQIIVALGQKVFKKKPGKQIYKRLKRKCTSIHRQTGFITSSVRKIGCELTQL